MVVCLLIGNILLAAIASSNPMYRDAALEKTLKSKYAAYIEKNNAYPGVISFQAQMDAGKGHEEEFENMKTIAEESAETLKVDQKYLISLYETTKQRGDFVQSRSDKSSSKSMRIAALSGFSDHIKMLAGENCGSQLLEDGSIPVVLSQRAMTKLDVILGDVIQFAKLKRADGTEIKIQIVGVFDASDYEDNYWVKGPSDYYLEVFMDEKLFQETFVNLKDQQYSISALWYQVFDYEDILPSEINAFVDRTEELCSMPTSRFTTIKEPDYLEVLKDYQTAAKKVYTTLLILQIPVLALLLAFIFMISRQMLDLEQNEIALLKSRGSSKKQILFIYFLQSLILSVLSSIAGVPLAYFLTKALGSTNGFLEFIQRKALHVRLSPEVFLYTLGAILVSVSFMVLPVIKDANVTIVNVKHKKAGGGRSIFSRVYLDVILLAVSLYGLYSFTARRSELMKSMLEGDSIDPFLFICSSLFIISASLVGLRLQPLLIKLVYYIGRAYWKPAFFASFLQIIRTRKKQGFMMVFLMFTVSLGIFNATVARTILSNSEKGIRYSTGTDLVLQQPWEDNSLILSYYPDLELTYTEPDFGVYENMEGVEAAAKVYRDDEIETSYNKKKSGENEVRTSLMAVDTKSFGETVADFQQDLLPVHINRYLNAMAKRTDAVLLSMNFHKNHGVELGDRITFTNDEGKEAEGVVYGFFEYFPGYTAQTHTLSEEETLVTTENYLIVANLAQVQHSFGLRPYQVWLKTSGSSQFIYDYAKENNISYTTFEDVSSKMIAVRNDALFQGTNGILTMSFIVILILCCTGFLIYWILSIRQRELLFGVFRAMGMTKKEVIQMLINEQIFSSGVSILIGTLIGLLASRMFVPLVQIFYASTDQAIPLEVVNKVLDMVRLFSIIGIVIIICMIVLGKLISKINISQALKLGED